MIDTTTVRQTDQDKIAIIGLGKAGTAIGYLLRHAGYPIVAVSSRSQTFLHERLRYTGGVFFPENQMCEAASLANCIFITTPDDCIGDVCLRISEGQAIQPGDKVIHMSGAGGLDLLKPAANAGASTACIHPLQSFVDVEGAIKNIRSSFFGVTAVNNLRAWSFRLVQRLGGFPFEISEEIKPLYHAAACIASNYLTTLIHMVEETYGNCGLKREDAVRAFWPLVFGTLRNIQAKGTIDALTGPISRGDEGTIRQHLAVLREKHSIYLETYILLGIQTVNLALKKSTFTKYQADRIKSIFEEALS